MRARSTTIAANPEFIDAGIAHVRDETMPTVESIDGFVGLSLMVDRESCRCIITTAWDTEELMLASAGAVRPIRDRAAQAFGASSGPAVDEWHIAVVRRDHFSGEGACVRATWLKLRPEQFDRAIDFYVMSVLGDVEVLEGFCSASLMTDRATQRAVSSVTFDSVEAMERTRDRARSLRTRAMRDLGADQVDVGEFELALAHLRVPEMA